MTDFSTMTTRVEREVQRGGMTADIHVAIVSAIDHYQHERFAFNFGTAVSTLTASSRDAPLPTGFLESERLEMSASGSDATSYQIKGPKTFDEVRDAQQAADTSTGRPTRFAIYQERIEFDVLADNAYEVRHFYLKDLPEISASASAAATNSWMTSAERMIRAKAKQFLYEDRIGNLAKAAVFEVRSEQARRKLKHGVPTQSRVVPTRF